jgi:hypothetical protein
MTAVIQEFNELCSSANPVFKDFGKIPRLNREIVITEKIDGTNACVIVAGTESESIDSWVVSAQSRTRIITPEDDNAGFARWVQANSQELKQLGLGYHYGEWWGQKIGRNYGLKEKRFSLFNVSRWTEVRPACCHVVPIIYSGPILGNGSWSTDPDLVYMPTDSARMLTWKGSYAAPGFMNPEGVVIWHVAAQQYFKITCKNDEKPKGSKELG